MYSQIKFGRKSVHLLEVFGTFFAKISGNMVTRRKAFTLRHSAKHECFEKLVKRHREEPGGVGL